MASKILLIIFGILIILIIGFFVIGYFYPAEEKEKITTPQESEQEILPTSLPPKTRAAGAGIGAGVAELPMLLINCLNCSQKNSDIWVCENTVEIKEIEERIDISYSKDEVDEMEIAKKICDCFKYGSKNMKIGKINYFSGISKTAYECNNGFIIKFFEEKIEL